MNREQQLIDITFQIALTVWKHSDWFESKTKEEVCSWVSKQLKECGFNTIPIGSSWGVLVDE
jgi:hypothetical protein